MKSFFLFVFYVDIEIEEIVYEESYFGGWIQCDSQLL